MLKMRRVLFAVCLGLASSSAIASDDSVVDIYSGDWSLSESEWISVSPDANMTTSLYFRSGSSAVRNGSIIVDQTRTTTGRFAGVVQKNDGESAEFDYVRHGSGGTEELVGYLTADGYSTPVALHRASKGAYASTTVEKVLAALDGTLWNTPFGRLSFRKSGSYVTGFIMDANGHELYRMEPDWESGELRYDTMQWTWSGANSFASDNAYLTTILMPGGKTLLFGYARHRDGSSRRMNNQQRWIASRYGVAPQPTSELPADVRTASSTSETPASSAPGDAPSSPAGSSTQSVPLPRGDGSFRPLAKYSVRLDQLVAGKDGRAHVFLTLKNASQGKLYVTSGQLLVRVTDDKGVNKENGQLLQPLEEQTKLFDSTPVLDPGDELKVQYAVIIERGSSPAKVRVSEGEKRVDF